MPFYIHISLPVVGMLPFNAHEKVWDDDHRYLAILNNILADYPNFKPSWSKEYDRPTQYPGVDGKPFKATVTDHSSRITHD